MNVQHFNKNQNNKTKHPPPQPTTTTTKTPNKAKPTKQKMQHKKKTPGDWLLFHGILVKSAQYYAMFDFDVEVLLLIAEHLSNIFDQFYSKCPATVRANLTIPELF